MREGREYLEGVEMGWREWGRGGVKEKGGEGEGRWAEENEGREGPPAWFIMCPRRLKSC